jgi:hypothetical protein
VAAAAFQLGHRQPPELFLWSSIPTRNSAAPLPAKTANPRQLQRWVTAWSRPQSPPVVTEFFGQWLGHHFDQFRGVDGLDSRNSPTKSRTPCTTRPSARTCHSPGRPVREILTADYAFNKPLAKFDGVKKEIKSTGPVETRAPAPSNAAGCHAREPSNRHFRALRTSPVKRGDWLLRRTRTPVLAAGRCGQVARRRQDFGASPATAGSAQA